MIWLNALKFLASEAFQSGVSCSVNSANIYLFKVNNKNISKRCEIFSKLTKMARERNVLVSLLLTFEVFLTFLCFCCWLWSIKCFLLIVYLELVYFLPNNLVTPLITVARQQWKIPAPENWVALLTIIYQE